ncbi:hypothetical protein AB0A74_06955 [Saccharothrix sp. NPDC042600]|uniref:hypothetical protein n=1 Tax=Saccharothrix TaxID=2071 RepID=UPI0033C735C0|nr:hypothetical protein GCM10017745_30880 [Saccharothrix mutabilis subsp. capreolus]
MTARQRAAAKSKPAPASEVAVTWRGTRFRLPTAEAFPLDALEAEEAGRHLTALRLVLGPEQYATWRSMASTAADAEEFSTVVMRELGVGNR